ncbi:thiamine biosynthesis protein ApbE [Xenophilus sp. AP218F]|nr:FAD:protein FMN transferase [Chromobacterium sp. ASV5]OWY40835.1 thiamine biosynthesis protein ApbE [Xenophilus sp. AP218F]
MAFAFALLAGCQPAAQPYQQESYVFGTRVEITVAGLPPDRARQAVAGALADLDSLHRRLHAWQPGSELMALNDAIAAGRPQRVAPDLMGLLAASQRYEALSDGLFSPAIGKLVALWGFHADNYAAVLPDPARLQALVAARPRMSDLTLRDGAARSANREVAVDLGGIAKGWALDRVRGELLRAGVKSGLINIGGNVLAIGVKPDGSAWKVGIQHPRENRAMAVATLNDGEAIGTSGDYQRYFSAQGRRHCHLVDPRDGNADCKMQAATVLTGPGPEAGMLSDAASKPLYLAGPARAGYYAQRFGVRQWLLVDGAGEVWISGPLARRLAWLQPAPRAHTVE